MEQWREYKTTDEDIKSVHGSRSLKVFYYEDNFTVAFTAKSLAIFTREEAISVLKDILKTLEDD